MESKYYTPTIEEFHIGFEFEELFQDKPTKMKVYSKEELKAFPYSWQKLKLDTSHSISRITSKIAQDKVRVKYLDQQDIEDLGFIYTGKSIDIWFEKKGYFQIGDWVSFKIKLHYGLHDNRLYIIAMDCGDEYKLFEGIVKNKSELKKILQQVGVL